MATPVVIARLGRGSFQLAPPSGETLVPGPWIDGNPAYPAGREMHRCDSIKAAPACKLLDAETVILMHFGTFPPLTGKPIHPAKLVPRTKIMELEPGKPVIW